MDALSLKVGDTVEFKICEVKRTGAKSAVDIILLTRHADFDPSSAASRRRTLSHSMSAASLKLETLPEEAPFPLISLDDVPIKKNAAKDVTMSPKKPEADPSTNASTPKQETPETDENDSNTEKLSDVSLSPRLENTEGSRGCFGWISTLKDTFGFIESLDHGSEIFFHYSEMQAPIEKYKGWLPCHLSHWNQRG
uniref:Uncharacterized protein n=2 Tax=Ciona savignyi TaxID=51511 RepID=H2Z8A3_CIOSA